MYDSVLSIISSFSFSWIAFFGIIIFFLFLFFVVAEIQRDIIRFVAKRFLHIKVSGPLMRTCVVGVIIGMIASSVISAYGGELLSLAVYLLSTWPFLKLWISKTALSGNDLSSLPLSDKDALILSVSGSFFAIVVFVLVINILTFLVASGFIALIFSFSR